MEYDNTDTFALFKHDKKGNEKAPDYSGQIFERDGTKRRLACWIRESKSGVKYMSGKIEDFREPEGAPVPQQQTQPEAATAFDDIPF